MSSNRNEIRYLRWLMNRIEEPSDNPNDTHLLLMECLDRVPYMTVTSDVEDYRYMDINRLEDGLYLRTQFCEETFDRPITIFERGRKCSWLEMLIAFSERTFFLSLEELGWETPGDAFAEILGNIGLWCYTDEVYADDPARISSVVSRKLISVMMYDIKHDGDGGLFPMGDHAPFDCRFNQLWDQANAYIQMRAGLLS